jgi:recombination protein RecA
VKVAKNKVAPPFRETEFDILYGISLTGEVIDLGTTSGLVEESGSWLSYNGERIGQGREAARQYIAEHPEALQEIRRRLLEMNAVGAPVAAPESVPSANDQQGSSEGEPRLVRPEKPSRRAVA